MGTEEEQAEEVKIVKFLSREQQSSNATHQLASKLGRAQLSRSFINGNFYLFYSVPSLSIVVFYRVN